jgi:chemotaxis protein CheX
MSVNFMNPFLTAATEVLQSEAGVVVNRGELTLHRSSYTTADITTLLSIVGDVKGVVLFSMDMSMGLKLVSAMLGQTQEEFNDLAQSGIAELGNVITGSATTLLAQAGYACTISVPTLIVGRGTMISTLDFQRLVVPLHTEIGTMQIHLALRENALQMGISKVLDASSVSRSPAAH